MDGLTNKHRWIDSTMSDRDPHSEQNHYAEAKALFLAACKLDCDETKRSFVESSCEGNQILQAEVFRLLSIDADIEQSESKDRDVHPKQNAEDSWDHFGNRVHKRAATDTEDSFAYADTPPSDRFDRLFAPRSDMHSEIIPATHFGKYQITRHIGIGGMGVVYEAQQDEPRRIVALKIIRPELLNPRILKRFKHETEVLAKLQHQGIAQIYEAGTAETEYGDHPYFAMEYVDGQPVTGYVAEQKPDDHTLIRLFIGICEAVQHAHHKGIIHRDLKPGNVLITADGTPKILDFGIARVTQTDVDVLQTLQTSPGQLVGTLQYMSPEQAIGASRDLDTRSDIYSIGVMLYEALTGRPPIELDQDPIPRAVQRICEEIPPRSGSIHRHLRGDLETILTKSIEKDRDRRYQSAQELASDLTRFINNEPILARPATITYQFGKFAQRNKALVGVSAGFIIMIVSVAILMTIVAVYANSQAAKATRFSNSLLNVVTDISPVNTRGEEKTVRVMLEDIADQVNTTLAGHPLDAAVVHHEVGKTYRNLADYEASAFHLNAAFEIRKQKLGLQHPDTVSTQHEIAVLYYRQGTYAEAETMMRSVLQYRTDRLGASDAATLESQHDLGVLLRDMKQYNEADELLGGVLNSFTETLGPTHRDTMTAADNLGVLEYHRNNLSDAHTILRKNLKLRKKTLGADHFETLVSMDNLAQVLKSRMRLVDAEKLTRETLEGRIRIQGRDHPDTLVVMDNLAQIVFFLRKHEEAASLFSEVIETRKRLLPEGNILTIRSMNSLANVLTQQSAFGESQALQREALQLSNQYFGESYSESLAVRFNLAFVTEQLGEIENAETLYFETATLAPRCLDDPDTATMYGALAQIYYGQLVYKRGEAAIAAPAIRSGFETLAAIEGLSLQVRQVMISTQNLLIVMYDDLDESDEADVIRHYFDTP